VSKTPNEGRPAEVERTPRQAGEAATQEQWAHVERAVWTERMLAALVTGVKGGRWFSLMDMTISAGQTPTSGAWVSSP